MKIDRVNLTIEMVDNGFVISSQHDRSFKPERKVFIGEQEAHEHVLGLFNVLGTEVEEYE